MSALERSRPLQARILLRPYTLVYLYRRRLRVHMVQELLAGIGVAIAVALVFAAMIANASVSESASEVVHAAVGPANLQLHARDGDGLDQGLLARVERLAGVERAAPVLEQTATLIGPGGRRATVDVAGTTASLGHLDGLTRTLPVASFSPGEIGLTRASAEQVGVKSIATQSVEVSLAVRGSVHRVKVAVVLGREAAGALAQARVAVMPLAALQQLAGVPGRLTRILIETRPGHEAAVRRALEGLADDRLSVASTDAEVALLRQALRPSDQASGFFAAVSALIGFLFAFNAMLLTVPERRRAIADLRLIGTKRLAIVQIVAFQALCLGIAASLVGLLAGYALSSSAFHQSSGYLAEAFTIGTNTVVGSGPLLLSLSGGILATALASTVLLLDLRRGRALDAAYVEDGAPDNLLARRSQLRLAVAVLGLLALATALFVARASLGFLASGVLALATVLAVPLVFAGVLRAGAALARRHQRLTSLQVALSSLKAATLRSLALAATGAVAIFGGIALGGSRDDLLRGIDGFAHSYAADAQLWVGNPGDNQATVPFAADDYAKRIARVPGVAGVKVFQGGFLELGGRRAWLIARPPGGDRAVLSSQIVEGNAAAASRRLGEGGWIAVSKQIAEERHARVGGSLTLPTPSGDVRFALAATTTDLAWSPGAVLMDSSDYSRLWETALPTALGVDLVTGASEPRAGSAIARVLGARSGLEVSTAHALEKRIDALTSAGLRRLGEISTLLVLAAILAMSAALGSSVWQRRASLAGLRLAGVRAARLRRILLTEAMLMLGAGCVTGAIAGIYGEVIIDGYLEHVSGFPVASLAASGRPLEIIALVIVVALIVVAIPAWAASRASPTLALDE
ncbi:MAG TPA: ABC transporter permease [Solirubrobacteraceae bacterium]|nr:ABC transporter permease [Solirubrobacteraceae bacterium]